MELSLIPRDRAILVKGLQLLVKAGEEVAKKSEAIGLDVMAATALKYQAESMLTRVFDRLGDSIVLGGDYDFPHAEVQAARVGVSLYLAKVSKVESAQEELSIPTEDTESRAADARDLADRMAGQTALWCSIR